MKAGDLRDISIARNLPLFSDFILTCVGQKCSLRSKAPGRCWVPLSVGAGQGTLPVCCADGPEVLSISGLSLSFMEEHTLVKKRDYSCFLLALSRC